MLRALMQRLHHQGELKLLTEYFVSKKIELVYDLLTDPENISQESLIYIKAQIEVYDRLTNLKSMIEREYALAEKSKYNEEIEMTKAKVKKLAVERKTKGDQECQKNSSPNKLYKLLKSLKVFRYKRNNL